MAGGAPGNGEAAPGDHLQSDYRLWLAGHQLEHGRAPWIDPYSFQPEARLAGERRLVAVRAAVLAARPAARLGGCLECLHAARPVRRRPAGDALAARARAVAARGALPAASLSRSPPTASMQSRGHLLGPTSLLLALALWAFERARATGRWWWWRVSWVALASIPLSGQVHLALGAIPFYVPLRALPVDRAARRRGPPSARSWPCSPACSIRQTVIAGSIDSGGRSLAEVRVYSATGLDFLSRQHAPRRRGVRLPRLADAAARDRRTRPAACSDASCGSRPRWASARSCRCCSRSARTSPSTRRSGTHSRRSAIRACRSG